MGTILAAGFAGLVLGFPVALIWQSISVRLGPIEFWPSCRRLTGSFLGTFDGGESSTQYGQLLKLLWQYLGRNVMLTAGASLPVILFVLFVVPAVSADGHWDTSCTAILRASDGHDNPLRSWENGPEFIFYAGSD